MLVVADSSALVTLATCESLHPLEALFQAVKVPQAVFQEVVIAGKPQSAVLRRYLEEKVVEIDFAGFVIGTGGLGQGELEAMALYKKLGADLLLIDDKRARKIAQLNTIHITGSLGVLLTAKQNGLVEQIKPLLDQVLASGLFIGEQLIKQALLLAGEM